MRYLLIILFSFTIIKFSFSAQNLSKNISIKHLKGIQVKNDSLRNVNELIWLGGGMVNDSRKNEIIYSLSYYADTISKIFYVYLMKTDTASIKLSNSWVSVDCLIVKGLTLKDIYASAAYVCDKVNDQSILGIVFYDEDALLNVYRLYVVNENNEKLKSYRKIKPHCGFIYIH